MNSQNSEKSIEKSGPELIEIEVCFALPERQELRKLKVAAGTSASDCIRASKIKDSFVDFDLDTSSIGVFGKLVAAADYKPRAGDRLEIYRPLIADPRDRRRQRASSQKRATTQDGKGGKDAEETSAENPSPRES